MSKKLIIIIAAVAVPALGAGGYFGYTMFLAGGSKAKSPVAAQKAMLKKERMAMKLRVKQRIDGPIVTLGDDFVVNLGGLAHFAKFDIAMKVDKETKLAAAAADVHHGRSDARGPGADPGHRDRGHLGLLGNAARLDERQEQAEGADHDGRREQDEHGRARRLLHRVRDPVSDDAQVPDDITVNDAVEVDVREETAVEAELGELADGLDQAALEELLLEEAPAAHMTGDPLIEEIELEQLLPFDGDPSSDTDIGLLLEVPLSISVELGRTSLTIRELLALGQGSILQLDRHAGEPVDVLVNGKRLARGEVVVIDEDFGIRVTEVVAPEERISGMGR